MYELGIRDIAIYTKGYGGSPVIAAINFVLPDNLILMEIPLKNMLKICSMLVIEQLIKTSKRNGRENTLNGYDLLTRWGVKFAKNPDGTTKLRHVSGHTFPRSLCSTKELIGVEIVDKLITSLKEKGIKFYEGYECVKVLSEK